MVWICPFDCLLPGGRRGRISLRIRCSSNTRLNVICVYPGHPRKVRSLGPETVAVQPPVSRREAGSHGAHCQPGTGMQTMQSMLGAKLLARRSALRACMHTWPCSRQASARTPAFACACMRLRRMQRACMALHTHCAPGDSRVVWAVGECCAPLNLNCLLAFPPPMHRSAAMEPGRSK